MKTAFLKYSQNHIPKLFLFIFMLLFTRFGHAFTVSPMNQTLDCAAGRLSDSFELKNSSEHSVIVAAKIAYREIDEHGHEQLRESDALKKQFFIFPPRLVIGSHERKMVRVAYKGSCQIPQEVPLRVIFEQLPFGMESGGVTLENGAKVNIRLKYSAALYLKPAGAKPDLQITGLTTQESGGKKDADLKYFIRVKNQGTAHQLLRHFQFLGFNQASLEPLVEFHERELQELVGQNLLPGAERVIELRRPVDFFGGSTRAALRIEGD
jgi:P pilus assembly chaperone PapD